MVREVSSGLPGISRDKNLVLRALCGAVARSVEQWSVVQRSLSDATLMPTLLTWGSNLKRYLHLFSSLSTAAFFE